jgi:tRNA(Arg) A34 adenosine deaminase TadA
MKLTDFDKIQSPIKKAHLASRKSSYQNYMIGAVVVVRGKILASGWSQEKTHPFIGYNGTFLTSTGTHIAKNMHAEIAAIFKVKNREILSGASIYVYRQCKNEKLANCRPCAMCYKMLQKYGFKKMIYSTESGFVEEQIK